MKAVTLCLVGGLVVVAACEAERDGGTAHDERASTFVRSLTLPRDNPADIVDGQPGWGADDLAAAYNSPTTLATKATIAFLIGGYNPGLEADLAVYRERYGLPACTADSGCLRIVDAAGGSSFSAPRYEDIAESSLEVQAASALCPHCKLLVVVTTDDPTRAPTLPELAAARTEAIALGATAMVTSYGASELDEIGQSWAAPYEKLFVPDPQVPLFAAAGDSGYLDGSSPDRGVRVPAAFAEVIAVGGTTISQVPYTLSPRRWTETALPTTSSGCSASVAKPRWQHDAGCPNRMTNDMAAAADGALVYFSTVDPAGNASPGWHTEGGTGESAAVAAGIFAAAGQAYNAKPEFSYLNPAYFNDLTAGSNGSCGLPYECSGQTGYDGPSGNGSPNGGVFAGTFLYLESGDNLEVPRGGSDGGELHTINYWAQRCQSLSFYATNRPEGVNATFSKNMPNAGNPFTGFALHATLTAPLVQGQRTVLVVNCDGTLHTLTVLVDVIPCQLTTSCFTNNGITALCGNTAPDGCGGTLSCGDCDASYTCAGGVCVDPSSGYYGGPIGR